jgi:tRNA-splicing ligase RtcB
MGTGSWVLLGTNNAARMSLSSCCHGAGRLLSRSEAKRSIISKSLLKSLESSGIIIRTASLSGLAEEAPQAYKDVDDVISVITEAGIAQKVARLRPIIVIKG